ncbi:MAG: hypothetical protein CM15mP84_09510 [Cellvibrionales bacterium]|nr:MAG: hypothetical protein CM15mP84_09510 [Cellvibrionales bacterium]
MRGVDGDRRGCSAEAQALLGRRVGMFGGEMYAGYRCLPAQQCMAFDDSVSAEQAASCFVNPMTALGFWKRGILRARRR